MEIDLSTSSDPKGKKVPLSTKLKRLEVDFNKGVWYSKTPKTPKKCKTPEKRRTRSRTNQKSITHYFPLLDSPSPTKIRLNPNSPSLKIDKKIPKVADLLKTTRELQKLQEIDAFIKKSSEKFLKELDKTEIETKKKRKPSVKDCKKLKFNQLQRIFNRDLSFLDGIFNGTIYSERHELFNKQKNQEGLNTDLRVSESLGVFTSEQLVYLISLFRDRYDNGSKYKYSDYYFKVLLPEFCLKIFMDQHYMSQESAFEYLKNVPIPDLFGIM